VLLVALSDELGTRKTIFGLLLDLKKSFRLLFANTSSGLLGNLINLLGVEQLETMKDAKTANKIGFIMFSFG